TLDLMNPPHSRERSARLATYRALAMVLAILGFVLTLQVSEYSTNRELWILISLALWGVAAIVGFVFGPRWLAFVHESFFKRK
ncbi:hypothetical protein LNV09_24710, partial [Paucibacter sp. B2R-40]|uniref:hypothetical protein n=1 Tax=Paucibacter sp. B2R-40 TaxID=2893554 RepID=UPI0021E3BB42